MWYEHYKDKIDLDGIFFPLLSNASPSGFAASKILARRPRTLPHSRCFKISKVSPPCFGVEWLSATRNKDPSGFITQRGRSLFTILRKGSPSSDAPRGEETGSLGEMKYAATKKVREKLAHPFLSVSLSRAFVRYGRRRRRLARSRQTSAVNFSVLPRENRTSSREGMQDALPSCSRVSTVALSRKKGVRPKKVREEFRDVFSLPLRDENGIAMISTGTF